jgi:hypothetical protein
MVCLCVCVCVRVCVSWLFGGGIKRRDVLLPTSLRTPDNTSQAVDLVGVVLCLRGLSLN